MSHQVDIERALPDLVRCIKAERSANSGIAAEQVDRSTCLGHLMDERNDLGFFRHIHLMRRHLHMGEDLSKFLE